MRLRALSPISTLLVVGLALGSAVAQNLDGLTLWFPFEGNAKDKVVDASGNGNDGTLVGGKRVAGKHGNGLQIGPADEYVEISGSVLTPTATVMFWFKPNWSGDDPGTYRLFDANTASIYFMIGKGKTIGDREQTFGFYFEDAADADFQDWEPQAADVIKAKEWIHVAVTWDFESDKVAYMYLDGQEVANVRGFGVFPQLNPTPKIGFNVGTNYMPAANGADGVFDEFAIFSRVLEGAEISDLMDTLQLAVEAAGKLATTWGRLKAQQ